MNLINEVDKPVVKKTVVIYAGRFQPFHRGHYDAYKRLVSKFGESNVYIGTSNDTSSEKSPFSFKEKKEIATTMFGIPSNRFIKVNNPYKPVEILSKFDGKTTQYVAAVGEKDATRLQGKYFKPYKDKAGYGYDEIGYTFPIPAESNPISGTDVRKGLGSDDKEKAKKFFLKAYPKFDKDIFKMITTKLNEGFPGGIGVGLELPGGYINGAPTGSTNESNNTQPSSKLRDEPHPTRHEREHPSDEPDWYDNENPYDPINEIINRVVTEELFEEFIAEYLGEKAPTSKLAAAVKKGKGGGNPALDQDISYTNAQGKQAKIKAKNALRLPKDHPAHIAAAKLVGPDDAPAGGPPKPAPVPGQKPKMPPVPGQSAGGKTPPPPPAPPPALPKPGEKGKPKMPPVPGQSGPDGQPAPEPPGKLKGADFTTSAEKNAEKSKTPPPPPPPVPGQKPQMPPVPGKLAAADLKSPAEKGQEKPKMPPTPGSPEDFKDKADKTAKIKAAAKEKGFNDSTHAMSDKQLDASAEKTQQKFDDALKNGDDKGADAARIELAQHKIEKNRRNNPSVEEKDNDFGLKDLQADYEKKYGEPHKSDIPYPDSDGTKRTASNWGGEDSKPAGEIPKEEPAGETPTDNTQTPETPAKQPSAEKPKKKSKATISMGKEPGTYIRKNDDGTEETLSIPKRDPKEVKQELDTEVKSLKPEEQKTIQSHNNPDSPERQEGQKKVESFVEKMGKHIGKFFAKKKEQYVQTGKAIKNLATGKKMGTIDGPDGKPVHHKDFKDEVPDIDEKTGKQKKTWYGKAKTKWVDKPNLTEEQKKLKHESEHAEHEQKHALKHTGMEVGMILGGVAAGGIVAGHGPLAALHHGAAGLAKHIGVDLAKHSAFEVMGIEHPVAAGAAAFATSLVEVNQNESGDFYENLLKKVSQKMKTFKLSDEQMLDSIRRYKEKQNTSEPKSEISESKQNSINHFVEYATKRLKLKETPKVTLLTGKEYSDAKSSLGGYNPASKEIFVVIGGRLTADILRTIAHEMVHRKQDELGLIRNNAKDGADGSPVENNAHAVAGILMREYGRINKQIYNEGFVGNAQREMVANLIKAKDNFETALKYTKSNQEKSVIIKQLQGIDKLIKSLVSAKSLSEIEKILEDINLDVDKGDTILMGKFKNKKVDVKSIGKDDHGMPTINGKQATTFRTIDEMGSKDIHFKNVVTYYDKGGPNIKKQVGIVVAGNKYANRNRVVGDLRNMGYEEIKQIEKELGIEDLFEKKNLHEVGQNMPASGTPDGGYVPKNKKRKLNGKDGVNKSEEWYTNGGYTQTDFPKADAIFGDDEAEERTIKYTIKNLPNVDYVDTDFIKEGLLMEGGAYGHMSHPFDDMDLTFGHLKDIITKALEGELGVVREKTDGQALAISWKNGRLIAARNKGHLAGMGANAMGIEDVASKFAGRGGLTDAYNFAMRDLSAAISSLSDAQRKKIFNEGGCFMNLEVIWPTSVNVIPYGQALLVFHNTVCYDIDGNAIAADNGAASTLAGMIKQVNADVQEKYTIQGPPITTIPKNDDLSSRQGKYLSKLKKLQSEFKLNDSSTMAEYHQAWWENFVNKSKVKLQKLEKEALVRRWAFGDKSFRLNTIADKDAQKWAVNNDKVNVAKQQKDNMRPFEEIFLGVGADVLEFVGSVLTVHPDKAIRAMKEKFKSVASQVRSGGDPTKIQKLKQELGRLNQLGGISKIVASEGIVFFYGGKTYKLTGTFAPLNQILGIFYE